MPRFASLIVALAAVLALLGCEASAPSDAERAAVETAIHGYLDALAASYSDLDAARLEAWASPQEIAAVRTLLRGLASTGDRVEARLRGVEVQKLNVFRTVNATVSLVEVWDIARFDAFTGRQKGVNPSSVQSSVLSLRLIDGSWKVTARRVVEDQPRSRWNVTTPTPAGGGSGS